MKHLIIIVLLLVSGGVSAQKTDGREVFAAAEVQSFSIEKTIPRLVAALPELPGIDLVAYSEEKEMVLFRLDPNYTDERNFESWLRTVLPGFLLRYDFPFNQFLEHCGKDVVYYKKQ